MEQLLAKISTYQWYRWLVLLAIAVLVSGGFYLSKQDGVSPTLLQSPGVPPPNPQETSTKSTKEGRVFISYSFASKDPTGKLLFIEHRTSSELPYSLPVRLHIVEPESFTTVSTIETTIKDFPRYDSYLAGDRVFFFDSEKGVISSLEVGSGVIHDLDFSKNKGLYTRNFLISPDRNWIVWQENEFRGQFPNDTSQSKLHIANLNDMSSRLLLERTYPGQKYIKPVRWSSDGKRVYFAEQHSGVGGIGGLRNLSSIHVDTQEVTSWFPDGREGYDIYDISLDERLIARAQGVNQMPSLVVYTISTGQSKTIEIPDAASFWVATNLQFSPDNKHLSYHALFNGIDYGTTFVVDLETGAQDKVIVDDTNNQRYYSVSSWIDNDRLLLSSNCEAWTGCDLFVINRDGSNLKKLEIQ